ncbi:MAG: NAD(P)-dependent dehydrogenase (short-subunit alcohol dehydrogenase family) [Flavobacterium sp.]|jgi:NAD(P)-dependent dehydrogenase (short-subunit alcohol dehydrogenase family)
MRLKNKTIVITGGAGGLGNSMATKFLSEGANVVLSDLDQSVLDAIKAQHSSERIEVCVADVTKEPDNQQLIEFAEKTFGGVDIFVANAGTEGIMGPIANQELEAFDRVMAINVRGPFLGIKYAMPAIGRRGGGSIIIVSSIMGLKGGATMAPYVASKHAAIGLMRSAALEGATSGVRVNTINPAPLVGRMMDSIEAGGNAEPGVDMRAAIANQMIPLGRYGEFEDMNGLLVLLASDESRFLTGGVYSADGGASAK